MPSGAIQSNQYLCLSLFPEEKRKLFDFSSPQIDLSSTLLVENEYNAQAKSLGAIFKQI